MELAVDDCQDVAVQVLASITYVILSFGWRRTHERPVLLEIPDSLEYRRAGDGDTNSLS